MQTVGQKTIEDARQRASAARTDFSYPYICNVKKFDPAKDKVYYSGPYWDDEEPAAVIDSILNGKWLSAGEKIHKFEIEFSKKFNHSSSVMVNSGSSANLVMIAALKKVLEWKDEDEIIVSPVGFPTTIAPIVQHGLKPIFIDIEFETLNFDVNLIEEKISPKTKAIFISPVLGNPPDFDKLLEISDKYKLNLILDNCDSLGGKWKGKFLNEYAVASSASFYPAHHLCTGEGGMVSSSNNEIIKTARSFAWWGRDCYCVGSANLLACGTCGNRFDTWLDDYEEVVDHKYIFSNMGYNLKPLDLQGAIGLKQLEKFDDIHNKRRKNKNSLSQCFTTSKVARTIQELHGAETGWFGVPIICKDKGVKARFVKHLEGNRIQTRNYFAGNILLHPAYKHLDDYKKYPNANRVLNEVFFVGCSPSLNSDMINYVKNHLFEFQEREHMTGEAWYGAELRKTIKLQFF